MDAIDEPWTRRDHDVLPEGPPVELVEGRFVCEAAPPYGHQRAGARIRRRLYELVGPDRVPDTPVSVPVDEHNVFQPDLVVLDALPEDGARHVGVPALVLEVLSGETALLDRHVKTVAYLALGVGEVWLADPEVGTLEVHTRERARSFEGDVPATSEVVPGLELVPEAIFKR
jgi:Uma2 family endonuclease